ncbi:MAG TPA: HDIG domain-containing protein, partial [Spirochaetia bacterium]|nr:HDIG domain-containing protein [Spirochaetia bacterium]
DIGLEVGRVADKDVIAERDYVYTDESATRLRVEAEKRLVPPIFVVDDRIGSQALASFEAFRDGFLKLAAEDLPPETFRLRFQREWPDLLGLDEAQALAAYTAPGQAFSHAAQVLTSLFERGIVAMPEQGLGGFNPDTIEIRRWVKGRLEYEQIAADRVPTLRIALGLARTALQAKNLPRPAYQAALRLTELYLKENASFDSVLSRGRLEAAERSVEPVVRKIERGERIIRKGFIVTETDMERLQVIRESSRAPNWGPLLGGTALLGLILLFSILLLSHPVSGIRLDRKHYLFTLGLGTLYFVLAVGLRRLFALDAPGSLAVFLPTGLFSMLAAILLGTRFAALSTIILGFLALLGSGFDSLSFAAASFAGLSGTFAARNAEKRIDLIRAGVILGFLQGAAGFMLSGLASTEILDAARRVAADFLNGFFCGVLTLGFLPLLEQALNSPTRFRLMELSDMNAPILKRLLTVAPGTYSHSVTVAHLAESACREIGANALLARVGAYYHDIGKIEQPEYFVENQAGYNKHDELNPRLSATVIRSHVKLGVERARSLGLPEEVVDIVAEHHGNGLIAWFYNQAAKGDAEAKAEDFSYPGRPPASREAAVVMLADTVEAATRTLKKPTLARLDQAIKDLMMDKVRQGQLDRSDLTFRDLETIRNTFVRILAGHFHSRIEYPKLAREARDERR